MAYRIIRGLSRLLLTLFYRRIEIVGAERIPTRGPLIITANHHNSLIDPMLVMTSVPRQLLILAAAPLFHNPVIGPFLRLVGALPVLRRQDGIRDAARNDAMFGAVSDALSRDNAVLLFPEGRTQPEPVLLPLRTGAARMLLGAATPHTPVTLLPVGLVFQEPGTFRAGWALVLIGPPVPTDDCVSLYPREPERAVRELTERLSEALRHQIIEADDRQTLRLMRVAETLWRGRAPSTPAEETARVAALQQVARVHHELRVRAPERLATLRQHVEAYSQDLERVGASDLEIGGSYPAGVAFRWAVREGLSLLLGFPLAIIGIVLHAAPYWLTGTVVRALGRAPEEEATYKIVAGTILYPVCWILEGWIAFTLGGGWAIAAFLVALLPTGFFALGWKQHLSRVARESRAFLRFLWSRDMYQRLVERRQALVDEITALVSLVETPDATRNAPRS